MEDWYENFSQTIVVWEETTPRPSLVLDAKGEPYHLQVTKKMGFDLTPKGNKDARKAQKEK